ncbi:MAG: GNAT family N-acetyltransferase, partial [bacterium]
VIGYAIGRVVFNEQSSEIIGGHLTSIAVEDSYRHEGIGKALMNQIHSQFAFYYPSIRFIELNCRPSNTIAINHYITQYAHSYYVLNPAIWHKIK